MITVAEAMLRREEQLSLLAIGGILIDAFSRTSMLASCTRSEAAKLLIDAGLEETEIASKLLAKLDPKGESAAEVEGQDAD